MFRDINDNEEERELFREWARENFKVGDDINELWHPIVRGECMSMIEEYKEKQLTIEIGARWKYG